MVTPGPLELTCRRKLSDTSCREQLSILNSIHHPQVTRETQRYYKDIEVKEEGGTPSIVESIRAGLVFQLKEVRFLQRDVV